MNDQMQADHQSNLKNSIVVGIALRANDANLQTYLRKAKMLMELKQYAIHIPANQKNHLVALMKEFPNWSDWEQAYIEQYNRMLH